VEENLDVKNGNNLINVNYAREYFNQNPFKIKQNFYFVGELDWENGAFTSDTLTIPMISKTPILVKKVKNGKTSNYIYPFLLITKNKANNSLDYNLKVFFSSNINGVLKDSFHLYNINNEQIINKKKTTVEPSTKTSKSNGCQQWGMFRIDGETGEETLLYTWWEFSGGARPEVDAPGDGGGGSSSDTQPVVDDKITNELTGKALCIYNLLNSSSSDYADDIKKFDGEFPVSHLKLTINNNLEPYVYGITLPPINYVTEVQISNTALETLSDLGTATVFAHEIIHAEIFRKMLSAAQRGTLNSKTPDEQITLVNSLKDNFPGLYDYYEKRYNPTWNHEMMANHYRGTIADIIQKFDNNRLPRSTYEAVAWVGLGKLGKDTTTIAWDNLKPEEKKVIEALIRDDFYNGPSNCN
jgi:hypothetical protein